MPDPKHLADITCPLCQAITQAEMPTDACQFFWECPACATLLRPKPGDCCVFCSYGSEICPPRQTAPSSDGACC
ncbi:MAG TPA: GDCCVxC domain-containing (seleno)protein [Rhodothermales bacterium]|nr:GDCCVxC domain-containing (seleno)protein [Rhodothermales bacterium]